MRTNSFSKNMRLKSNQELETIFDEKENYTDEAIQAVVWELEDRNLIEKTDIVYHKTITEKNIDKTTDEILEINEGSFDSFEQPSLYSKKAIQGFTIFFSTIFGVILLMSNLRKMEKPEARMQVLIFGIGYTIITGLLANYLPRMFFISLIFNLIGYVVLVEYFWNKYLGKELEYKNKSISKPLIISILFALFMAFILISNNEIPGMKP